MKQWLVVGGLWFVTCATAQTAFTLGAGCSNLHCGPLEDDNQSGALGAMLTNYGLLYPGGNANYQSGSNVGCSTTTSTTPSTVACMYQTGNPANTARPVTVVYTPSPNGTFTTWSTYTADEIGLTSGGGAITPLGTESAAALMCSAPMLGSDGGMITADYEYIRRYAPGGTGVLWSTTLPYYGVADVVSGTGQHRCGQVKAFSDGSIGICSISGPCALVNGTTGAVIGPSGCGATSGGCALYAGIAPGSNPGTATDFWGSQKEGGGINGSLWYKSMQWSCTGNTAVPSSGSCTVLPNGTQLAGALLAIAENSTTGLSVAYVSPLVYTGQYSSPMVHVSGGNTYIYGDQGSNPPLLGVEGAAMVWQDTGSALNVVSGFPFASSAMAQGLGSPITVNTISSGGTTPNYTVTFNTSSTTGVSNANAVLAASTGQTNLNTNWAVTSFVVGTSVTVNTGTTSFSTCASGCGTITPNSGGSYHSSWAWDPNNNCAWNYLSGEGGYYCVPLNGSGGTTLYVATGAGFVPGAAALNSVSDRNIFTNAANGHTIMITSANVQGTQCYIVAIDMSTGTLLWYWPITGSSLAEGQFAAGMLGGQPFIVTGLSSAEMVALYPGGSTFQ